MATVILGGGIIGLSTAFYLSKSRPPNKDGNLSIHIVDNASSLLLSASGYAGGFLALDWFAPSSASLGALSFRLHRELAQEHNGQRCWGYAGSHVYSLSIDDRGVAKGKKKARDDDWLLEGSSRAAVAPETSTPSEPSIQANGSAAVRDEALNPDGTPAWITPQANGSLETIASPSECAQVEPRELCEFLLSECQGRGVQVHLSTKPASLTTDSSGSINGINLSSSTNTPTTLPCNNLILSAGAWTPSVFKSLFPQSILRLPISSLAGHSLTLKSPRYTTPFINPNPSSKSENEQMSYGFFCAPCSSFSYAPEAFARLARQGETEIWIGGLNSPSMPLPSTADEVKGLLDPGSIADLRRTMVQLTGLAREGQELNEDDLETIREALCFRPVSDTGVPIVGRVPERRLSAGVKGNVYVASGHGPWGITLSLGTGLVVAEMVEGKERLSADVKALGLR